MRERLLIALLVAAFGCSPAEPREQKGTSTLHDEDTSTAGAAGDTGNTFVARGTAYYPSNDGVEGGFVDRRDQPLRTLQGFLNGEDDYVSTAMDSSAFEYGTRIRITELNDKYGKDIVFKVVDTGGDFQGQGTSRIDICTASLEDTSDETINGELHIQVVDDPMVNVASLEPNVTAL